MHAGFSWWEQGWWAHWSKRQRKWRQHSEVCKSTIRDSKYVLLSFVLKLWLLSSLLAICFSSHFKNSLLPVWLLFISNVTLQLASMIKGTLTQYLRTLFLASAFLPIGILLVLVTCSTRHHDAIFKNFLILPTSYLYDNMHVLADFHT